MTRPSHCGIVVEKGAAITYSTEFGIMARKDGKPEIQHYVPKVLLKNFASETNRTALHVFDKHSGNQLPGPTSINKICGERRYYDASVAVGTISLEQPLSDIESDAGHSISKIVREESLSVLEEKDRQALALFIAVQFLRVPRMKQAQREILNAVLSKAKAIFPNAKNLGELESALEENSLKLQMMRQLVDTAHTLVPLVRAHKWLLLKATPRTPFWLSDCPVTMHNDRTFGPYGNIGFALPGIQIYMPLCPTLTLALWEKGIITDHYEQNRIALRNYHGLKGQYLLGSSNNKKQLAQMIDQYDQAFAKMQQMLSAFEGSLPLQSTEDNVVFCNWLQFEWSFRFLMSATQSFALARRMFSEHPDLRTGIRMKTD